MNSPKTRLRHPPAFQLYASDELAAQDFRLMSLAQRGLYMTMKMECWASGSVPADPDALAKLLGLDREAVEESLSAAVRAAFAPHPDRPDKLICPELEQQRANLMARRESQSTGGSKGAERRWRSSSSSSPTDKGTPIGDSLSKAINKPLGKSLGAPMGPEKSRDDLSRNDVTREAAGKKGLDPFVRDYEAEERRK